MTVPQSDTIADRLDTLRTPPAPEQSARRAAIVVALHAQDHEDEELLLDALGLNGRPPRVNFAPQRFLEPAAHAAKAPPVCGQECASARGYWRHQNAGQSACEASREAYAEYQRRWRAGKGPAR